MFLATRNKAKHQILTAANRLHEPAWEVAFEVALELAEQRTDDPGIEAPYRALALLQMLLDDRVSIADGFMANELDIPEVAA